MNRRTQPKWLPVTAMKTALFGMWMTLYWFAWNTYNVFVLDRRLYWKGNLLIMTVYAILLWVLSRLYGAWKLESLRASELVYSQTLSLFLVNTITYMQISLMKSAMVTPAYMVRLLFGQVAAGIVWTLVCGWAFARIYPPRRVLFVYDGDSADELLRKLRARSDRYDICEEIHISAGIEAVLERTRAFDSIIICDVRTGQRKELVKYCFANSIQVFFTSKILDVIVRSAQPVHLFDTPLLLCRNAGLTPGQRFIKRSSDIALSLLGLALTLPLMVLVAVAIHMEDKGPVFFSQTRLTEGGRIYTMYKFRSMLINAERDGQARLASKRDERVTKVGWLIRRLRIDELPQLINILKGDMSLVGPRPERPELARQICLDMPEFAYRLKVKAGLTGYAQVMGKYNTTPYDKLKLDLTYIENYSILLDIQIILMTVKVLFMPHSTEGIEESQKKPADARAGALVHTTTSPPEHTPDRKQ